MSKRRFYETVAAAIKDFAKHGYDSQERLEHWRRLIEAAARSSFVPLDEVENDVRKTMTLAYYRLVTRGGLLRRMPQISAYTLQQLTPKMQAELNRRIISSIDLIKLNRPAAIAKTVQRFTGWATSVPEGGFPSDVRKGTYKYIVVKSDLQKAMTSLPFEERRVIIDQNAKLISAINAVAAEGGGAIAAVWESHKHQKGYDGRPAHNKREGQMFLIRDNWAIEKGLVKRGAGDYTDSIEQPGEFVFCRCSWVYIFNVRDLPAEWLTKKGEAALAEAKQKTKEMLGGKP
jgi:hypothetical protein